jgi:hypothetical protein
VAYLRFESVFFLRHFGVVINGLLLGQVLHGEIRGEPWTSQFSKRLFPIETWRTQVFMETNRFISRVWAVVFASAIVMTAFGTTSLVLFVLPNVLALVAFLASPSVGRWYGRRLLH